MGAIDDLLESDPFDGYAVADASGRLVGRSGLLLLRARRPLYLEVRLRGLFGSRPKLVPWEIVDVEDKSRTVFLNSKRALVKRAPMFERAEALSLDREREARSHFGLDPDPSAAEEAEEAEEAGEEPVPGNAGPVEAREAEREPRAEEGSHARGSLPDLLHAHAQDLAASPERRGDDAQHVEVVSSDVAAVSAELSHEPSEARTADDPLDFQEEAAFRLGSRRLSVWHPLFDVVATPGEYQIIVDLPGVDPDDLEIVVKDGMLKISGSRPAVLEGDAQRLQRPAGRFVRRLELPAPINAEAVEATLEKGLLELRIPRPAHEQTRRIALRQTPAV
jgi:HSP20 family protein